MWRTPAKSPSRTPVSDTGGMRTVHSFLLFKSDMFQIFFLHINVFKFCHDIHIHTPIQQHFLSLLSAPSLPLSGLLQAIFTSKLLHYLPSLRAIRNGVTLSGRHGHCIRTTHPLS